MKIKTKRKVKFSLQNKVQTFLMVIMIFKICNSVQAKYVGPQVTEPSIMCIDVSGVYLCKNESSGQEYRSEVAHSIIDGFPVIEEVNFNPDRGSPFTTKAIADGRVKKVELDVGGWMSAILEVKVDCNEEKWTQELIQSNRTVMTTEYTLKEISTGQKVLSMKTFLHDPSDVPAPTTVPQEATTLRETPEPSKTITCHEVINQ